MNKKVSRIKIDPTTRRKNKLGKRAVPCMVSDRWIEFPERSDGKFPDGEFISIRIMTDAGDTPRQLSSLIVTREDLLRTLQAVKPKK